jgi:hypothetical protein
MMSLNEKMLIKMNVPHSGIRMTLRESQQPCMGTEWKIGPSICRYYGSMLGITWGQFGVMLASFWDSFRVDLGSSLWSFLNHCGIFSK